MHQPGEIINGFIAKGFGGHGDWGTVVSQVGATRLLDAIHNGHEHTEGLFYKWSQADYKEKAGLFHFVRSKVDGARVNWGEDIEDNWRKGVK